MRYSDKVVDGLLALLRVALGNESPQSVLFDFNKLCFEDWDALKTLATRQGVPAIALDGLQSLCEAGIDVHSEIDHERWSLFFLNWVGLASVIEQDYESYKVSLSHLASLYQEHEIPMMVLKGYGLSLNYPKPNHRPIGDLDIYLFGKQQEGDAAIRKQGVKVDSSHHHHTTFEFEGLFVENHYDFLNIYSHRGNMQIEESLKRLSVSSKQDEHIPNVCYPTDEFNALFLLRHMGAHFAAEKITLRHLLDWALAPQVVLDEEYKMQDFRQAVNAICNHRLGFSLPVTKEDKEMENRVFYDIIHPYSYRKLTLWVRFKRWFAHRWKNRLFYHENLFLSFWMQLWSHVVRPLGHA